MTGSLSEFKDIWSDCKPDSGGEVNLPSQIQSEERPAGGAVAVHQGLVRHVDLGFGLVADLRTEYIIVRNCHTHETRLDKNNHQIL